MSERWHRSRASSHTSGKDEHESERKRSKSWDFEMRHNGDELVGFNPAAGFDYAVNVHSSSSMSSCEEDEVLSSSDTEYFPYASAESRRPSFDRKATQPQQQQPKPTLPTTETAAVNSASVSDMTPVGSPSGISPADAQICVHVDGQYMSMQAVPSYFPLENRLSAVLHVKSLLEQNLMWINNVANTLQDSRHSQQRFSQPQQQSYYIPHYGTESSQGMPMMYSQYQMQPPVEQLYHSDHPAQVLATGDQDYYNYYV
jgi:hypothetical protein